MALRLRANDGTLESINLGAGIGTGSFEYNASTQRTATFWATAGTKTSKYLTTGTLAQESYPFGSNMDDSLGEVPNYASMSYRVDSAGRIRASDDRVVGYKPPDDQITGGDTTLVYEHKRLYVYDAMGRYTGTHDATLYSWTCGKDPSGYDVDYGSLGCPIDTVTSSAIYQYDAVGNLSGTGNTLVSGGGDQMATASYSGIPISYTYDADGNVLTRSVPSYGVEWTYSWSAENRLLGGSSSLGTESFDYDALGRPVVTRDGDGKVKRVTLYDGGSILADLDSAGNRQAEYVYDAGTDRPYLLVTGPTTVTGAQYFVQDAFGNVKGTVYDSLSAASTVTYSDWGVPTVTGDGTTESVANRLTWKGLPYDAVLGLTYVRARWYDPLIGRFVSEDPLGLSAGINPYVFANDDPINGADPSGMDPDCFTFVVSAPEKICETDGTTSKCWNIPEITNTVCTDGSGAHGNPGGPDVGGGDASHPRVFHEEGLQGPGWADPFFLVGGLEEKEGEAAIDITEDALEHVLKNHTLGGASSEGKSLFHAGEDVIDLVRNSESIAAVKQSFGGNYQRIIDAGREIGIDRDTWQPSSIYTVITNRWNRLVTMFPGSP